MNNFRSIAAYLDIKYCSCYSFVNYSLQSNLITDLNASHSIEIMRFQCIQKCVECEARTLIQSFVRHVRK